MLNNDVHMLRLAHSIINYFTVHPVEFDYFID